MSEPVHLPVCVCVSLLDWCLVVIFVVLHVLKTTEVFNSGSRILLIVTVFCLNAYQAALIWAFSGVY